MGAAAARRQPARLPPAEDDLRRPALPRLVRLHPAARARAAVDVPHLPVPAPRPPAPRVQRAGAIRVRAAGRGADGWTGVPRLLPPVRAGGRRVLLRAGGARARRARGRRLGRHLRRRAGVRLVLAQRAGFRLPLPRADPGQVAGDLRGGDLARAGAVLRPGRGGPSRASRRVRDRLRVPEGAELAAPAGGAPAARRLGGGRPGPPGRARRARQRSGGPEAPPPRAPAATRATPRSTASSTRFPPRDSRASPPPSASSWRR